MLTNSLAKIRRFFESSKCSGENFINKKKLRNLFCQFNGNHYLCNILIRTINYDTIDSDTIESSREN